jgi:hypothetical protein
MKVTVYHLTDTDDEVGRRVYRDVRFGIFDDIEHIIKAGGYHKVAVVTAPFPDEPSEPDHLDEIDSLDFAFERTNHIRTCWTENPEVEAELGNHRSTSVGDLAVVNGKVFIVHNVGWEETKFAMPE